MIRELFRPRPASADPRTGDCTPGYSSCGRCQTSWDRVERHVTQYTLASGCFPLCERCWQEMETPERRLPFYRVMFEQWQFQSPGHRPERWGDIEAAVLKGK